LRLLQGGLARAAPDLEHATFLADVLQPRDAADVDQMICLPEAELQQREKTLSTGEHLAAFAVLREQGNRLRQRGGSVIVAHGRDDRDLLPDRQRESRYTRMQSATSTIQNPGLSMARDAAWPAALAPSEPTSSAAGGGGDASGAVGDTPGAGACSSSVRIRWENIWNSCSLTSWIIPRPICARMPLMFTRDTAVTSV